MEPVKPKRYNMTEAVRQFRYKIVKGSLDIHDGNVSKASRYVGMSRSTFERWVQILGLSDYAWNLRWSNRFRFGRLFRMS